MKTPLLSILYFAIAAALGAIGQYLYKSGVDGASASWLRSFWNLRFLGGLGCYVAVMVCFVMAFKRGGSLTVLYPIYATTFIWAALISWAAYRTPITWQNVLGFGLLLAGMYLMGRQP